MTGQGTSGNVTTGSRLASIIAQLPRVRLANLPTPLEEAPRLRESLGPDCPRILVKRDDLTGFAFGGNKARHVEFRLADIQRREATSLVLANPAQSNHVRMHAALAAKFGLDAYVLKVPSKKDYPVNGNLLLDYLFGATILEASSSDRAIVDRELDELVERLRTKGQRVYDVPRDPYSKVVPVVAYMDATLELSAQLDERGIQPHHVFLAGSSSASGIALAGKCLGLPFYTHPVSVRDANPLYEEQILQSGNRAADHLGLDCKLESADLITHDSYVGSAWGETTPECLEALSLAARTEGLILDPVFTAKAMAALIDQIRRGAIAPDETVVFIHTGGQPITFAYADEVLSYIN